ncbi:MAG: B12-binding domain-containing protein [bacterium]
MADLRKISSVMDERRFELSMKILKEHLHSEKIVDFPANREERSLSDILFHLKFLSEAIYFNSKSLFNSYLLWCVELFESIGLKKRDLIVNINAMKKVFADVFNEDEFETISEFLESGKFFIGERSASKRTVKCREEKSVQKYLSYSVKGDRKQAEEFIMSLYNEGMSIQEIYTGILQESLYRLGRMWQTNRITVAEEHLGAGTTEYIMSQFYQKIFAPKKSGKKIVAACVSNELHQIGLRMVSDMFEYEGWETLFIGANTPASAIVDSLAENRADMLALSVTMAFHLKQAEKIISEVSKRREISGVKIIVGEYPFILDKQLYKKIGARAFAETCETAVKAANNALDCS